MAGADELLTDEWRGLEEARLRLARLRVEDEGSIDRAYRRAVTISGAMLGVGRVGVWALDPSKSMLRCVCLRDAEHPERERELPALKVRELGSYERALVDRRAVAAEDVALDVMTKDLVDEYFAPLGITSTLDVPFYRDGRVAGVVCHEHRGPKRAWSDRDVDFATTVADVVGSLALSNELAHAIDGLRAREVALEQALRSEAIGRIARAVAHDLGNLLSVISMTSELVHRRGDQPEVRAQAVQTINEATESAMRLSRQLLAVAGRSETSGGPRVLDDAITRFVPALRGLAGSERVLEIDLAQPGAIVPLDRSQIEQVLLNLVVNAREATPIGGRISVRTREAPRAPGSHWPSLALEVSDDGTGMDDRTRMRVFDPYFSTKDGRKNSGLGLATVRGIVAAAGGEILVASAPGKGTTFSLRLPVMDSPAPSVAPAR
jgi:signal transduction histidine kinase